MIIGEYLHLVYFGNTVSDYILAFSAFHVCLILLKIFKELIHIKLKKISEKTDNKFDDLLVSIIDVKWPFYFVLSLYLCLWFIKVPDILSQTIHYLLLFVLTYYAAKGIQHTISYVVHKIISEQDEAEIEKDTAVIDLIGKIAKVIVWIVAVLFIISNLGYDISTLLAGLGIGGIAIAFALQNVLSDIFASFSIYLDRPFVVGDYIVVGADSGVVQKIGIKSTRVQTLQGEELIISNKELTETRVNNFKKLEKRRVVFSIGVAYETTSKKLKEIPTLIENIIKKIEKTEFVRAHFTKFGDSSLLFEVVYNANSGDFTEHRDIKQKINLAIKEILEKKKINIAYPTQTLYVKKTR